MRYAFVDTNVIEALSIFADHRVDFADALVAARMSRRGISEVFSFDTHFDRLPGVIRCGPESLDQS